MEGPPWPFLPAKEYRGGLRRRECRMSDEIEYCGYRLSVRSQGSAGWKIFIYPPNGVVALEKFPHSEASDGREAVIEEAKRIVDEHLKRRR